MKLYGIRLLVKDFDNCFNFYSGKLKLKVTWGKSGGDYASYDIGNTFVLSIFKTDLMASAIGNIDKPLSVNCREKTAIIIQVDDVDKSYNDLSNNGVTFINEPRDMTGWGMRAAHFRDPEDNLIEIWSELSKDKWDEDLLKDADEFGQ